MVQTRRSEAHRVHSEKRYWLLENPTSGCRFVTLTHTITTTCHHNGRNKMKALFSMMFTRNMKKTLIGFFVFGFNFPFWFFDDQAYFVAVKVVDLDGTIIKGQISKEATLLKLKKISLSSIMHSYATGEISIILSSIRFFIYLFFLNKRSHVLLNKQNIKRKKKNMNRHPKPNSLYPIRYYNHAHQVSNKPTNNNKTPNTGSTHTPKTHVNSFIQNVFKFSKTLSL